MAWIKVELSTPCKPEVIEMSTVLDKPLNHVFGALIRLWIWADEQFLDGKNLKVSEASIDNLTGIKGFAEAMRQVGWLEGENGKLILPRFNKHNGVTAKKRAENLARQQKKRGVLSVTQPSRSCHKSVTRKARQKRDTSVTPELELDKEKEEDKEEEQYIADATPLLANSAVPAEAKTASPKSRKSDPLFDAVALVTGTDPKASGSHVGKVCKALRQADPPYTPDEVHRFAQDHCEWIHGQRQYPSLGYLEKNIGKVRAPPPPVPESEMDKAIRRGLENFANSSKDVQRDDNGVHRMVQEIGGGFGFDTD